MWAVRVVLVKRPARCADEALVSEDRELLLANDEALGRRAAVAILASDAAVESALYVLRCSYSPEA